MTPILTIRNLTKTMSGHMLLDLGSFDIPASTCIVLSGRNGAGKTTLLKIIAGIETPDSAEIDFQEKSYSWQQYRPRLRQEIVYLHQHPYMFDRSVAENVAYGLRRRGADKKTVQNKVHQALEWAGLLHLADRNAQQLSGGEKQRVALTRARVLSPKVLLLDEPFSNMDLGARKQTISLIAKLKSEGISTIVTTHEPEVAEAIGDAHRHLCKTGPSRFTIVQPFLYQDTTSGGLTMDSKVQPPTPSAQTNNRKSNADVLPSNQPEPVTTKDKQADTPIQNATAVILAGGRARRMGGDDKGLIELAARPMIEYIIDAVRPQVKTLIINANRNLSYYQQLGFPVVEDMMGEYFGPLVGMASAMQVTETEYLLTVPCDSPLVPPDLAERLYRALERETAEISVAHDGERMQPVFALIKRDLLTDLINYLEQGGRKIDTWYAQHRLALADFSTDVDCFLNVNTPDERNALEKRLKTASVHG